MITYDVFDNVLRLRDLVDGFFNEIPLRGHGHNFPLVNVYNSPDEVEIRAHVPGLESDDLDIEVVDNNLVIAGNKKADYQEHGYLRKERTFGNFKRLIPLPARIDRNKIKADLINGILIIKLYKSEEAKPKKIEIN